MKKTVGQPLKKVPGFHSQVSRFSFLLIQNRCLLDHVCLLRCLHFWPQYILIMVEIGFPWPIIVCIGVTTTPPPSAPSPLFVKLFLRSANCPRPPFLGNPLLVFHDPAPPPRPPKNWIKYFRFLFIFCVKIETAATLGKVILSFQAIPF